MTEPTDERLLELAGKATPGLREVCHHKAVEEAYILINGHTRAFLDGRRMLNEKADADFIAACSPDRIRALVEGKRRAEEALRVELNELLKRNEGRTHWAGCETEHPMCAAIGRIRAALPHPTPEEPANGNG
jgi:hypothetical protein